MAVTSELTVLHQTVDELRTVIGSVRSRYGDIPAVQRLAGDVERIDLDAADLDAVAPPTAPPTAPTSPAAAVHVIDDTPLDPSLWADADDEGVGGYHRGGSR
jgi:hypothetical protein